MNIGAIGMAVNGLAKGYMEGERHRAEMDEREQTKQFRALQIEEAGLKLGDAKREREYRDQRQKIYDDEGTPQTAPAAPAGGIAAPGSAPVAAAPTADEPGAAPAPQGGIATPGAAPAPAAQDTNIRPGSVPPSADLARMERIIAKQQQLDLKFGKIDPLQALEGMKKFKLYQEEGIMDGLRYFQQTGDTNGAITRINATGRQQMPQGTTFQVINEEVVPGSGVKVPNVYAISPDGSKSLNYRDLLRSSLSPKDALSLDNEVGVKLADLSIKREAEQNLASYRTQSIGIETKKLDELVRHHKEVERSTEAQRLAAAAQLGDLRSAQAIKARMQASDQALDSIMQSLGVSKEVNAEKLSLLPNNDQQAYRNNLSKALTAHTIWKMNMDPKGNEGISTSDALQIVNKLPSLPASAIKTGEDNISYFEYGKKKVSVPNLSGGSAPAPAQEAPRPGGIKPPAGPEVQGRPLYNASRGDLVRISRKPPGVSSAEAAEAQAELNARQGESRISSF